MAYKTYNLAGEKWCNKCKEYHPLHEFGKNNKSADGKDYKCSHGRRKRIEGIVPETKEVAMLHPAIVTELKMPILESQVLYKYQRPDFYDLHISKNQSL